MKLPQPDTSISTDQVTSVSVGLCRIPWGQSLTLLGGERKVRRRIAHEWPRDWKRKKGLIHEWGSDCK